MTLSKYKNILIGEIYSDNNSIHDDVYLECKSYGVLNR